MPMGHSGGSSSSIEVPSFQTILVCQKLTGTITKMQIAPPLTNRAFLKLVLVACHHPSLSIFSVLISKVVSALFYSLSPSLRRTVLFCRGWYCKDQIWVLGSLFIDIRVSVHPDSSQWMEQGK